MQHVKGCNTTKKTCVSYRIPFFISKADHRPKQPSLGTLWSFTLEQPLLSLLKLTSFIINRKQKLSKKESFAVAKKEVWKSWNISYS